MATAGDAVQVWEVWHFRIGAGDEIEFDKDQGQVPRRIGMYSTEANAAAAVDRLRMMPGFEPWPRGFRILTSTLDRDAWDEGFITFEEAWAALPDPDVVKADTDMSRKQE